VTTIKTLVYITMKDGRELRIDSPEDTPFLVQHTHNSFSNPQSTIGFKDETGRWVIVNAQEVSSIEFIPKITNPHE